MSHGPSLSTMLGAGEGADRTRCRQQGHALWRWLQSRHDRREEFLLVSVPPCTHNYYNL